MIRDHKVTALLDSGANCSVLGKDCYQLVEKLKLQKFPAFGIATANDTQHFVSHFASLPIKFEGKTEVSCFLFLAEDQGDGIKLKKNDSVAEPHDLNREKTNRLIYVIDIFPKIEPSELGRKNLRYHTNDTGLNEPIKQSHRFHRIFKEKSTSKCRA